MTLTCFITNLCETSVFAQYTVLIDNRDCVQASLKDSGIPKAVHYPVPVDEQPAYEDVCCPNCTPIASRISEQVMSLPMHPDLTDPQQKEIVAYLCAEISRAGT